MLYQNDDNSSSVVLLNFLQKTFCMMHEENRADTCTICELGSVIDVPEFRQLLRVTSDSRIWSSGGQLGYCEFCGAVQKIFNDKLATEVAEIYNKYNLYFQGRGEEQKIFKNGLGRPRSELLVDYLLKNVSMSDFKKTPQWLDLGCGTGHLLRTLATRQLGFKLFGADISEKNRDLIENIDGVCGYFANGIKNVEQRFDFLSLSHVLEHVPSPVSFLCNVRDHLSPEGYLIIAVPNWKQNPFDLLVVDHCFHFSSVELSGIVRKAGFEILSLSEDVVSKELVLIARPRNFNISINQNDIDSAMCDHNKVLLTKTIDWLITLVKWAKLNCDGPNVGLFGTALAATWLDSVCQSSFAFFSDEDKDRFNVTYLGRPVFSPAKLPSTAKVLVPLPSSIALKLCERLNIYGCGQFCPPPELV